MTLATNFVCVCFTQPCFNDLLVIQGRLIRIIVSSVNNELKNVVGFMAKFRHRAGIMLKEPKRTIKETLRHQ